MKACWYFLLFCVEMGFPSGQPSLFSGPFAVPACLWGTAELLDRLSHQAWDIIDTMLVPVSYRQTHMHMNAREQMWS